MKYSLEQIWNLGNDKLISILGRNLENKQKLKSKVSVKLYNEEKLDSKSSKIISIYDDYYEVMKNSSSLEEGLSKLRKCELNDYDSDENPIDPITMQKIKKGDEILNERRCYDKLTLKNIINNGDGKDPYTRNKFSSKIIEKMISFDVINGVLDLSSKNLTKVPKDLPINVKKLILFDNNIKKIQKNSFNELSSLEELDLTNNEIEKIEDNSFLKLKNLQKLHLEDNKLKSLNKNIFNGLINLEILGLENNEIEEIEYNTFKILENINEINLMNNKINENYNFDTKDLIDMGDNMYTNTPEDYYEDYY